MEAIANSVEDKLIEGLSFKSKAGASYITERKSVTFHPQGSNIYSTNGTKLIKILLTGDQFADPSTFRIAFDVVNMESDADKKLRVLGGAHTFFRRMRILCGGTLVEDISDYNRVHEMFRILNAKDANINSDAEQFGQQWDLVKSSQYGGTVTHPDITTLDGIKGGESHTVLFKPCSGLFNQEKFLPLRYMPITIELELCNDPLEVIASKLDLGGTSDFTTANTSLLWQLQNVQVKVDCVTLDNQLDNSYAEHVLSGKALPINYQTYISQTQSTLTGDQGQEKVRLNVTRALSRLKNVFVTLNNETAYTPTSNLPANNVQFKYWNKFFSPYKSYTGEQGTNKLLNTFDKHGEIADFQIQVGSKNFPEYPVRSIQEAFYQLRKTLGSHDRHNSIDITSHEYKSDKFILGIDMEKVSEHGYTGISIRSGDIMSIRFDHTASSAQALNYAKEFQIVLTADCVLEVKDSGVTDFD